MTKKRILIIGLTMAVLLAAVMVGKWTSDDSSGEDLLIIPQAVGRKTLDDVLTVTGELRRDELQEINSPVDGKVSEVDLSDGDEVVDGDTLFSLDGRAAVAVHGDFAFFRSLDVGAVGPDVEQLETILSEAGYSPGRIDKLYTEQTRTALARWQIDHEYGGATPEPNETITASLQQNAAGYDIGKANSIAVTITPSVPAASGTFGRSAPAARLAAGTPEKPVISVSASPERIDEGGSATFTLTASPAPLSSTSLELDIGGDATGGDSDDDDADYAEVADTFIFPGGQTSATVTINSFVDDIKESDEDITLGLSDQFGDDNNYSPGPINEASVIINANGSDVVPTLTLESDVDVMAEDGSATITVTSDVESNEEIEIFVEVVGNAVAGDDYEELDDEITLGADSTEATFDITPREDNEVEGDEFLIVKLVAPPADAQQYFVGDPNSTNVVIESADIPEMTLTGGGTVSEGGSASFTIVADEAVAEDTSINYQIGGTADAGEDFETLSGTVVMRAGQSSVTVSIVTLEDDVVFQPSDMIVANWPARVGTVEVDDGEFVLQGEVVLTLTEPTFTVTMKVSPTDRAQLEVGQEATVELQAGNQTVDGVISELDESATVAEDGTESYEGVVEVTGDLAAVDGAAVTIDVTLDQRPDVVAVPVAAVVESGGEKQVRVVDDDGTLKRVTIEVGLVDDDFIEVTKGLDGGELVVVSVEAESESDAPAAGG